MHKNKRDPPYRSIISQIGTVAYDLSKYVNNIIVKYMPKQYQTDSTYDFLSILCGCNRQGMPASLHVKSLFSNVPVEETVDIILHNCYEHVSLPPTKPRLALKELLLTCTTKTPFRSYNGDLYVQKDGVSMGNPLGPTFANYYMCELENKLLATILIKKINVCSLCR